MPNELRFDVQFSREDIEAILANPNTTYIIVSGTYTYRPDLGQNVWEMTALADGCGNNKIAFGSPESGCIRPCPTT